MTATWDNGIRILRAEAVGIVRMLVIDAYSEIICRSCAQHTDLMNRSVVGFGSMWPDLRAADVSPQAGHA